MARRVIALLGEPLITENGTAATSTIKPGHLVDGVSTISKHASAGGACPRNFALEQDYMGKDIDTAYATGDTVRVGSFKQGDHVYAFIPSGVSVAENARLESAGDGTLKTFGSGVILARALEAVNNGGQLTEARIRVQVM